MLTPLSEAGKLEDSASRFKGNCSHCLVTRSQLGHSKKPILSHLSCADRSWSNKALLTFAFVQLFASVAASAKRETQKQTSDGICFLLCPTQDVILNACAEFLFYLK